MPIDMAEMPGNGSRHVEVRIMTRVKQSTGHAGSREGLCGDRTTAQLGAEDQ